MDSIRFGYDPMVYVVEKQDPPPAVAASGPPTDPGWASAQAPASRPQMTHSECQGCIAEQGIQHVYGSNVDRTQPYHPGHDHMTTNYNPNRWQVVQSMNIQGPPPAAGQSVHHAVHMQMQPPVIGPVTVHEGPGHIRPINMQDTQMNMQQPGNVTDAAIGASHANYVRGGSYPPQGQIITGPGGNMQMMSPSSCTLQEGPKLLSPRSEQSASDAFDSPRDDGYSSVASVSNQAPIGTVETSSGAYDTQYGASINPDYSIQSRAQPVVPPVYGNRSHEYSYERSLSQPNYMNQPIGISFAHKTADGKLILVNSFGNQGNTNPSYSDVNTNAPSPRDPYMQPLYRNERGDFTSVPTRTQPPPSQLSYHTAPPTGEPTNYSSVRDSSSVQTSPLDLKVSKLDNVMPTQDAMLDVRSNTPDEVCSLPDDNVTGLTKTTVTETQNVKPLEVVQEEPQSTEAQGQDKTVDGVDGVKKGTPLYGLPSWWGEDEASCQAATEDDKADEEVKQVNENSESGAEKRMDGETSDPAKRKPEHAYLEISLDDMNVNKPPIEETRNGAHTPPTRDTGPGEEVKKESPNMSATAFTIDLGEENTDKKATRKSLSDFLPSKMRKSFKQRETEAKKDEVVTRRGQKSEESWDSSKSPHAQRRSGYLSEGNKSLLSSEEEDISIRSDTYTTKTRKQPQSSKPTTSSTTKSKGHTGNQTKPPTRPKTPKERPKTPKDQSQRGQRSADNTRSGAAASRVGVRDAASRVGGRDAASRVGVRDAASRVGARDAASRVGARDAASRVGADPLRATKSTPYLIEKMFTPEAGSYKDDMDEQATEFALYKEARAYSSQNISSSHRSSDKAGSVKSKKAIKRVDRTAHRPDNDNTSDAGTYTVEQTRKATRREPVEDNVSEAGTYTIDAGTSRDEQEARHCIDEVFGVPGDDGGAIIDAVLYPEDDHRSITPTQANTPRNSTPLDDGRSATPTRESMANQDHRKDGYYEQVSHDGLTWVTQWASVVSHEANNSQTPPPKAEEPALTSRKGTGRRLPTPPNKSGSGTPTSQTSTPREGNITPRSDGQPTMEHEDDLYSAGRVSPTSRALSSVRSLASVDTNVLLGDTDDVMNALGRKTRISDDFDTSRIDNEGDFTKLSLSMNRHSDSEGEDTYPEVNGSVSAGRPDRTLLLKTRSLDSGALPPKAVLSSDFADRRNKNMTTREKVMRHMASRSGSKKVGFPSEFEDLGHSDGHSESEGYSESASYTSTDISEMASRGSRPSSAKAAMSNTRVNRAFALRRARADGSEPESIRSTPKTRTTNAGRDYGRPSSAKDTSRSDMSLGAQIVKKCRDNNSRAKSTSPFQRTEGGRNSWRDKKQGGIPRKIPDSKVPKPQSSSGLAITGQKSESNRPQSAKTAEYSAWRRRKDYDPRRAAAEAKKPKETAKTKADSNRLRMQRSQSTGGAVDSGRRARSATNSSISSLSSDDFTYDNEPQLNSNRSTEISKMSTALATNLDSLSRSLGGESREVMKSYNSLLVSSIYQLSLKLKAQTERMVEQLRQQREVSGSPSPVDEVLSQPDIPANPELAIILKNLRKTEHKIKILDRALFPDDLTKSTDSTPRTPNRQQYLHELERIQKEIGGFKPIPGTPSGRDWKLSTRRSSETLSTRRSLGSENTETFDGDEYY